jgi:hypothetical protein
MKFTNAEGPILDHGPVLGIEPDDEVFNRLVQR